MDLSSILSAILAGGLSGQIVTLFLGNSLVKKRDFEKWLIQEKFKLYSDFLSLIAYTPREIESLETWDLDIRNLSLKIFLLFPRGNPPQKMEDLMEKLFQLAKRKKEGDRSEQLSQEIREATRNIREILARDLHK